MRQGNKNCSKLVSIITPTYNHEKYIGQCIESVLAQTYSNWEQIIIDDGSTDNTKRIVKNFPDHRISYYQQEHKGIEKLAEIYNLALEKSRGEIVAILEGDDYWPPQKLEKLIRGFDDPGTILSYGITKLVNAQGEEQKLLIPKRGLQKNLRALTNNPVGSATRAMADSEVRTFTFPCSVMIRKDVLKKIGGFRSAPGLSFVDYPTLIELSLHGIYYFIPEITGYWRQHNQSDTQTRDESLITKNLFLFVKKFFDRTQALLALPPEERSSLEMSWRLSLIGGHYRRGRYLLATQNWREARKYFRKAIVGEGFLKYKLLASIGYMASLLHRDLELVYSLAGRASIKNQENISGR